MSSAPATLVPATASAAPTASYSTGVILWVAATTFVVFMLFIQDLLLTFEPSWILCAPCERDVVCVDGVKAEPRVDRVRAFTVALGITVFFMLVVWVVIALAMKK